LIIFEVTIILVPFFTNRKWNIRGNCVRSV